jgi:hypothetical protein
VDGEQAGVVADWSEHETVENLVDEGALDRVLVGNRKERLVAERHALDGRASEEVLARGLCAVGRARSVAVDEGRKACSWEAWRQMCARPNTRGG